MTDPTIDLSKDPGVPHIHDWQELEPRLPSDSGRILAMDFFAERLTVMCVNGPYQLVDGEWHKLGAS